MLEWEMNEKNQQQQQQNENWEMIELSWVYVYALYARGPYRTQTLHLVYWMR